MRQSDTNLLDLASLHHHIQLLNDAGRAVFVKENTGIANPPHEFVAVSLEVERGRQVPEINRSDPAVFQTVQ
jgi:hypothetical protein